MISARPSLYPRRDRFRQLQAFCYAAKFGSMTLGAEHLLVTQPAVSLHVRELERELETLLFRRNGPRISLTPAGECLYELAMPLVEGMEDLPGTLAEELEHLVAGNLYLVSGDASTAYLLPRAVKRLRDEHPEIRVHVKSGVVGDGLSLLLANEVHLVFGSEEPVPDEIVFRPVLSYDVVLIVPPDHPLAGRESVSPEEITAFPLIRPNSGTDGRQGEEFALRNFGVEGGVVIDVGGWDAVEHCVEAGLGVAVCGSFCLGEESRVSAVPLGPQIGRRVCGWFMRRDESIFHSAERLVEAMAAEFPGACQAAPGSRR